MPQSSDILPIRPWRQRLALAAFASLAAVGVAGAATSGAEAYYERALMQAADARCHLFSPQLGSALGAATAQARGAALRGGATNKGLAAVALQAGAKQAGLPCNSKDLGIATARVRAAFDGYGKLIRLNFPGDVAQKTRGTGLGLSLVRALAELHGGSMSIESRLGEGTSVTVRMPVMHKPKPATAEIIAFPPGR